MPSDRSAYARGYRSISVGAETNRDELQAGAAMNGFSSPGEYVLWLHRQAFELAAGKGFSSASEWFARIRVQRAAKTPQS